MTSPAAPSPAAHSPVHGGRSAHAVSGRAYVVAWLALLALTLLSLGAHFLDLGAWATAVSLAFAALKATVVVLVFMHVRSESVAVRTVAVLNVSFVLLLSLGIALDVGAH
jgi:cytochrome c oxidase subunit IV